MGNARAYNITILKKVSMEEAKEIVKKYDLTQFDCFEITFYLKEIMNRICIITNKNELNKMYFFEASGTETEKYYTRLFKYLEKENILKVVYGIDDYSCINYDEMEFNNNLNYDCDDLIFE